MADKGKRPRRTCDSCKGYSDTPLWGHTLCSYHGECSGKYVWLPNSCESCQQQKAAMLKLTEEEKPQELKELHNMLKRTSAHKQHKDTLGVRKHPGIFPSKVFIIFKGPHTQHVILMPRNHPNSIWAHHRRVHHLFLEGPSS